MNKIRTKRPLFGAFSFTFIYCWYNAYWRYFEDSPVAASLHTWGFAPKTLMALVSFSFIAGVAVSLCPPWSRLVEQKRQPVKMLIHLFAFFPFQMFTLFSGAVPVILLGLSGGFCIGAVAGRSFYTMFFEILDIHPVKVVVIGYAIIQTYVHLGEVSPLRSIAPLYYALEAMTLLAALVLSYLRLDEEEMEQRRILPENSFRLADIWQILGMIVLIQICLTLYEFVVLRQTVRTPVSDAVKIIPTVLKLLFLALFGRKLTLISTLFTFLGLFTCTIGAFILFDESARVPVQLFMEPAYGFVDLIFVWILVVVFYTYGRNQFRLKACIVAFFFIRFVTMVGCEYLFSTVQPGADAIFFVLLPVLLVAFLVPAAERAVKGMEAQRAYAEKHQGPVVPLPPERVEIIAACESLLRTLPEGSALSRAEQTALAYLIDGQYSDVTAHFLGISVHNVGTLNNDIFRKFNVKSSHELMIRLGAAQADTDIRERREALFERYSLTEREKDVCVLLLKGLSVRQSAGELGLAFSTVNGYYRSLYRKLNISSKGELFALFGAEPATEWEPKPALPIK